MTAAKEIDAGQVAQEPKWMRRLGVGLSSVVVLFNTFDAALKLMDLPIVHETMASLGWPASSAAPLGVVLLACTALYAWPRTAVLGATLLTAYLGGAVATHARVGSPIFSHLLFGVYLGVLMWGGLYLRDARVRNVLPFRR